MYSRAHRIASHRMLADSTEVLTGRQHIAAVLSSIDWGVQDPITAGLSGFYFLVNGEPTFWKGTTWRREGLALKVGRLTATAYCS
jgi:hypothetical protein